MNDSGVASGDETVRHQGRREQREPGGDEREPEPAHERVTERASDGRGLIGAKAERAGSSCTWPAAEVIDACCDAERPSRSRLARAPLRAL